MTSSTQYGNPLFLSGFDANAFAEQLTPVHFSKVGSEINPYDESWLQDLIMRHPSLLPVDQIEPAFNLLIPICRELPIQAGSLFLDNLLVTPAGDLALVECKLWRNPQARREVVAQILDYANAMSTWNYQSLEDAIALAKPITGVVRSCPKSCMTWSRLRARSTKCPFTMLSRAIWNADDSCCHSWRWNS